MRDGDPPATHIIVGTKAQFIKMAPVARVLETRKLPYRILDLGQHGSITPGILADFGLEPERVSVLSDGVTVATYGQAFRWSGSALRLLLTRPDRLKSRLLRQPAGFALIHGDTLSTLVGAHLARRLGLKVGLVEAGLSSGRLLDPFPEELIRRHVEARSDLLFVPDEIAEQNLKARNLSGRVINTQYNTGRDALLAFAGQHAGQADAHEEPSGTILTLHRAETLSQPKRLESFIGHVLRLAPSLAPVHFYLHEPTSKALTRMDLLAELEQAADITLRPLAGYKDFVSAMVKSRYVLTDGGSIQEEASYLNKPCIILRRTTERPHGLGKTAMLTSMDVQRDLEFLTGVEKGAAATGEIRSTVSASEIVVDACYS